MNMSTDTEKAATQANIELLVGRVGFPFFTVAAVVLFVTTTFLCIRAVRSLQWPTVVGTVTSSSVTQESRYIKRQGLKTFYIPTVQYSYVVAGESFTSDVIHISREYDTTVSSDAMAVAGRYSNGAQIEVRYDSSDPSTAALEVGVGNTVYFLAFCTVAASLMSILMWWMLRSANRKLAIIADTGGPPPPSLGERLAQYEFKKSHVYIGFAIAFLIYLVVQHVFFPYH